jgi:hypothetical protein
VVVSKLAVLVSESWWLQKKAAVKNNTQLQMMPKNARAIYPKNKIAGFKKLNDVQIFPLQMSNLNPHPWSHGHSLITFHSSHQK